MRKEQIAMITMILNGKHKYFSNFDCFNNMKKGVLQLALQLAVFTHHEF
jgi:hypothetical protein